MRRMAECSMLPTWWRTPVVFSQASCSLGLFANQPLFLSAPSGPSRFGGLVVSLLFTRGGNVFRSRALQNLLGALLPIRIVAVDRDKQASFSKAPFIALGLVLRHSQADQGTGESTKRPADSDSAQKAHDRTGRNKRSHAWNGQRPNPS